MVNRPKIVLANEPAASLDKKSGRDVVDLIQGLAREDVSAVILVTHDNRILDVVDRILHEVAKLEDAEVNFIMELSMMQKRAQLKIDSRIENPVFDEERTQHFLDSLYAIAQADGISTNAELLEIEAIAAEFGFSTKGPGKPGQAG